MSITSTEDNNQININNELRRKRINRLKYIIIVFGIVFLFLPTICCVILSFKVVELHEQVNKLAVLYNYEGYDENVDYVNIAYAAQKPSDLETNLDISPKESDADEKTVNDDGINLPTDANTYDIDDKQVIDNKEDMGSDIVPGSNSDAANSSHISDTSVVTSEVIENPNLGSGAISPSEEEIENTVNEPNDADNEVTSDNKVSKGRYADKKVYLTFDDGPSVFTDDILDILKEYGVKATFFVIGKTDLYSKEMYKRIVDEGHTLGMHSYSHKYDVIYNSVEDFDKDFTKLWNLLYDTTGLEPKLYRFPGGSANKVNKKGMKDFIRYLNEKSIVYYDWNVLNGDATGVKYSDEQLIANILDGLEAKKNAIVLMHDAASKEATVRTLPELLNVLIKEGAELYPLDTNVTPIQMIKAGSIN